MPYFNETFTYKVINYTKCILWFKVKICQWNCDKNQHLLIFLSFWWHRGIFENFFFLWYSFVGNFCDEKQTNTLKNITKVITSCCRWCYISLKSHLDTKWLRFLLLIFWCAFDQKRAIWTVVWLFTLKKGLKD